MSDELLSYYKNELSFIRRMGAQFAQEYPKIAERLRLTPETCQDPHAERMIEAFAFLTARIRRKLDDEFPEIAEAMLEALYPHYLAPQPSMAIAQFQLDRSQADLTGGYSIPAKTLLESEPTADGPCQFRTVYPTTVWPIEVASAALRPLSLTGPAVPKAASAMLRIELRCFSKDMAFGKLQMPAVRFFLKGQDQHVFALYELIFNNTVDVALAGSASDNQPVCLGPRAIRPVGFEGDESMFPASAGSFPAYRLLSEYFSFPRKFLFFEIAGLTPQVLQHFGNSVELRLYHTRTSPELEQNISADTLRLGCSPIVNLFGRKAEPIQLTQLESEYRVVPDSRRPISYEVYSVDSVTGTAPDGREALYQPFYSIRHAADPREGQVFWHASRRAALRTDGQVDHGTEVYLSLVDLGFSPQAPADWTLDVQTTCLNRDLPARPPFSGGRPGFALLEGGPIVIECLTQPTPTMRPGLRRGMLWRLISHLSLNHLSLGDPSGSPDALREILKLYDLADSDDTRGKIAGILSVNHRRVVGRGGGVTAGGFCRGVEVSINFDEEKFPDNSVFLFASVLERFLALYCSVNSFSQLVASTKQRNGELRTWSPRVAERVLL